MTTKIDDLSRSQSPQAVLSVTAPSIEDISLAVPPVAATHGGRIPVLDGLRGIAIIFVIIFHVWAFGFVAGNSLWDRIYSGAAGAGWAGVDLFFVLSGFLITGILYDSRSDPHYYRTFYARRTVRIFPLYYACLALFFGIIPLALGVAHHPELSPSHDTGVTKLFVWTYTINWYQGLKGFSIISPSLQHFWSLSIEEQFYFAWPFLVLTLARRRLMGLCIGLVGFAFVLRVVLYQMQLPDAAYLWTFCRTDSLAIGAMVALAARDARDWDTVLKWASRLTLPAFCGIVAVMAEQVFWRRPMFEQSVFDSVVFSLLGVFFGGCLAMAVSLRKGSISNRTLASPFLRFFGKYSYCLYICHQPIIILLVKFGLRSDRLATMLGSRLLAVLAINGIAFATAIVIALASWNLFEKHWLKLKDLRFLQYATGA